MMHQVPAREGCVRGVLQARPGQEAAAGEEFQLRPRAVDDLQAQGKMIEGRAGRLSFTGWCCMLYAVVAMTPEGSIIVDKVGSLLFHLEMIADCYRKVLPVVMRWRGLRSPGSRSRTNTHTKQQLTKRIADCQQAVSRVRASPFQSPRHGIAEDVGWACGPRHFYFVLLGITQDFYIFFVCTAIGIDFMVVWLAACVPAIAMC